MITNDQMIGFVKRWRTLEDTRRQYEYDLASLMSEIRGCFLPGSSGDDKFLKWVQEELRQNEGQAQELLRRARAVVIVPEASTWDAHGTRAVLKLAELPKYQRAAVLNRVSSTGYALSTVIRQVAAPATRPAAALNQRPAMRLSTQAQAVRRDAVSLATFIHNLQDVDVPDAVMAVVQRYVVPPAALRRPSVIRRPRART